MKQKVAMKDDEMNVNNSELRQLIKLKEERYLLKYQVTESYSDGTHDVTFLQLKNLMSYKKVSSACQKCSNSFYLVPKFFL